MSQKYADIPLRAHRPGQQVQTTLPTNQRSRQRDTEEDNAIGVTPRSVIRHRPIGNRHVIPMTDGTEMHVTERELSELPEEYQNAAELITPHIIAAPHQKRHPKPNTPYLETPDVIYAPASQRDTNIPEPTRTHKKHRWSGSHWLLFVGIGMLAMLVLWTAFSALLAWWNVTQDDIHYGRPRTFQMDIVIGHNDSQANPSHFLAINLDRHIEVIELPGGDASHARIYLGPVLLGDGQDLTPVSLSFKHVNATWYMLIHVQGQVIVFLDEKGQFRPLHPDEHPNV